MRTMIATCLLLAIATIPLPAGHAAGCSSTGFGDESCSQSFRTCSGATYLSASASVDEPGWVNARGVCSDQTAQCSGTLSCTGYSPGATSTSGNGFCEGSGNGGYWTVLSVTCGGMTSEKSPVQEVVDQLKQSAPLGGMPVTLPQGMIYGDQPAIWILGNHGVFAAFECTESTGCSPIPVACSIDLAGWTCRA